ncbi:MAG: sigma-70 family RNA polymerase sigma factor [Phycisphaerales bacterium]|jgi:RNA polymerase sigma-70 factor (ECF subfamily)
METENDFVEWVRQAQLGDRISLDRLAEGARQRLYAYIYRLTLNHDLAQDLLQETLLKMVENVKELEHPERFWNWLFRTALGVVQHYYRDLAREQAIEFSSVSRRRLSQYLSEDGDDGLNRAIRKELSETIVDAMARLRLTHRNVLMLRCFEQMSFAEIAELMGCKELRARVLFFRARHSLSRQLSRRGLHKGLLVTALGLFGLLTAPTDTASASTVTAASLKVGLLAAAVGKAGTPSGVATVVTAAGFTFTLTTEHFILFTFLFALTAVSLLIGLYLD